LNVSNNLNSFMSTELRTTRFMATECDLYLFDNGFESGHGDDSDPYRHERAEEVTELQHVILHDAEDYDAWLVTGMIKLFRGER